MLVTLFKGNLSSQTGTKNPTKHPLQKCSTDVPAYICLLPPVKWFPNFFCLYLYCARLWLWLSPQQLGPNQRVHEMVRRSSVSHLGLTAKFRMQ
ncbi:hypothetical protein GDO81_010913 [Engystomops pustulosus]|uniref:Uncharacterized protein n=1 Tax=Engystomops pustulosus TaxID=76066 RepID=A0AAV7C3F8_ENGPU|nr:hypothetical protein GDO81_010913 [Engystomops pustulosus]